MKKIYLTICTFFFLILLIMSSIFSINLFGNNINKLDKDNILESNSNRTLERVSTSTYATFLVGSEYGYDHIYSWGDGDKGRLGLGKGHDSFNSPNEITTGDFSLKNKASWKIKDISAGENGALVTVNDGKNDHIYGWGSNEYSQLGLGTGAENEYDAPIEITTGAYAIPDNWFVDKISYGDDGTFVLLRDDVVTEMHLYGWGHNSSGLLGLGNKNQIDSPQEIDIPEDYFLKDISIGTDHSLVLSIDLQDQNEYRYHLYSSGANEYGQLGMGDVVPSSSFREVTDGGFTWTEPSEIKSIYAGNQYSSIITNKTNHDEVWTWGNNDNDQLGLSGKYPDSYYPDPKGVIASSSYEIDDNDFVSSTLGSMHYGSSVYNSATDKTEIYDWGSNSKGQLGLGDSAVGEKYSEPQKLTTGEYELPTGSKVTDLSFGEDYSAIIISDGNEDKLYTWGDNSSGQLGLGDNNQRNIPTHVDFFNKKISLQGAKTLSTTSTSAEISVDVGINASSYSLDVIDSKGAKLGESDAIDWTETGDNKTFTLSGLESLHTYSDVKVVVQGDSDIFSNTFDITTQKSSITELKDFQFVGDVRPTSVDISVNAFDEQGIPDIDVEDFSLELVDSNKEKISEASVETGLNKTGNITFTITGLESDSFYGQVNLRNVGGEVYSNAIELLTPKKDVTGLENFSLSNVTSTTADVSIDVIADDPSFQNALNDYGLQITDVGDNVIGTSVDVETLSSIGTVPFQLIDLQANHDYGLVKVNVIGTSIVSETIELKTTFKDITSLEHALLSGVADIHSADVTVDVVVPPDLANEQLNDFSLEVVDSSSQVLGTTDAQGLNESGTTIFKLSGLEANTEYIDLRVKLVDSTIVSNKFTITTAKKSISKLENVSGDNITTNSVDVSVDTSSPDNKLFGDEEEVVDYSLEIVDSTGAIVGTTQSATFSETGLKTFNVIGLEADHDYGEINVVVAGDHAVISSDTFSLHTLKKEISILDSAVTTSTDVNSAVISVNASVDSSFFWNKNKIENVVDYKLEVIDANDETIIGKSSEDTFNTTGTQTFDLTELKANTTYDAKVRLVDNHSVVSNNFQIITSKKIVSGLSAASTVSTTYNSAIITVEVEVPDDPSNEIEYIKDYSLEVIDENSHSLGESGILNTTGIQTFEITGLEANKDYDNVKVRISDDTKIVSNEFQISTKMKDITSLDNANLDSTTYNSATISVNANVNSDSLTEDVNVYTLIVVKGDDESIIVGTTDGINLNKSGKQTFNINDLEANKDYGSVKVGIQGKDFFSNEFNLSTEKKSIDSLTNAFANDKDVTQETAIIHVTTNPINNGLMNEDEEVKDYSLEVTDSSGTVIGDSQSETFNTSGDKTFDLINLEVSHDYGEVKVIIKGDETIVSNEFHLITKDDSIESLVNAKVADETYNSASISVYSSVVAGDNGVVKDYSLVIVDMNDAGRELGRKDNITKDGEQLIDLEDLIPSTTYDSLVVKVVGKSVETNVESFTIDDVPFIPQDNSFIINEDSIKKDSFEFSIDMKIIDSKYTGEFKASKLKLFYGKDKEIEIANIPNGNSGGTTFKYKASGLISNSKYSDFHFEVDGQDGDKFYIKDKGGNSVVIKTKKNMRIAYETSGLIMVVIVLLILAFIIIILARKKKKRGKFSDKLRHNFF